MLNSRSWRHILTGACLVLMVPACAGKDLTVAEYAAQAEDLVGVMEAQFSSLDAEWEAQAPTLDGAEEYWDGRLGIRTEFLNAVRDLDPPAQVASLHRTAVDVFSRITEADEALAERVATLDTITDHWEWTGTPEGQAADAILEEVFAFCRISQAEFDATGRDEGFGVGPWMSPEVEETVKVAFGCPRP